LRPTAGRVGADAGLGRHAWRGGQASGLGPRCAVRGGRWAGGAGRVPDRCGRRYLAPRRGPLARLRVPGLRIAIGSAALLVAAVASEVRLKRAEQPLTDAWKSRPIEWRGATRLGISFRPPQVDA